MHVPVIIFALLLLTAIFLYQGVDVKIRYQLPGENSGRITLTFFFFWRLFHLKYEIKPEKAVKTEAPGVEGIETAYQIVKKVINAYKKNRETILKILPRLHVRELNIQVYPATGDACSTGILSGLIWTMIGSLDAVITHYIRVDKRNIMVLPEYSSNKTRVYAFCIINLKIANIIVIGILIKAHCKKKLFKE